MSQQNISLSSSRALTGRQEHYLKRELLSQQVKFEITEFSSPTALERFGAPFKSKYGEISPFDSEFPILRYLFVQFGRKFPFLDHANEKEFWQDKLQVFLSSFANKHISSSEDRLEETKRKKLSIKCQKMVELMMVSAIPTASGYEERIRFSELEVVEAGAFEHGIIHTLPEGHYTNSWDVNVAGVRTISFRKNFRTRKQAEFILRVKRKGESGIFIGRRLSDFKDLRANLTVQLPGKLLPALPKKGKNPPKSSHVIGGFPDDQDEDDSSSVSGISTEGFSSKVKIFSGKEHRRSASNTSRRKASDKSSINGRKSSDSGTPNNMKENQSNLFWRENDRVTMRAFLRTLLRNPQIASSNAMYEFLTKDPINLSEADKLDISGRKMVDQKRVEEQEKFYEIARNRAAELDVFMEDFRRNIIENNGLSKLLQEVREKSTIQDLSFQHQKFAEWLRIEVAATLYHIFLAEDNSPEIYDQAKKIHSMIPYTIIKNAIRIANPAAVMASILDLFLAKPFGTRSLMQRIFSFTLSDGIRTLQKNISTILSQINETIFSEKLKKFCDAEEEIKDMIRKRSQDEKEDIIVTIMRSELFSPKLSSGKISKIVKSNIAWKNAIDNINDEIKEEAVQFSHLKQLLKLYTRQRDKAMMLSMIEEPVTLQLLKDLFTIFYEPIVRVYKTANIHNRVVDFSDFVDDMITVVDRCRERDFSADPNQTVQAFIDLCARHEHNLYGFIHDVHTKDNGLLTQLIEWVETIISFLKNGPKEGKLDMNALYITSVNSKKIDHEKALKEIDDLIDWQEARKKWHQDKTRQKMAADGTSNMANKLPGDSLFQSSDFGLNKMDMEDFNYDDAGPNIFDDEMDSLSPIVSERMMRDRKNQVDLRRTAGEPVKPPITELGKIHGDFLGLLREVLSN
ncbi:PX domain-containing protein [Golovinomyces cichoracearum]|uniref:PX domain-containing protein n=1 Tax=Golovinomyces cichoracearum TaxID=62708 RepID=A0A420HVT4_9PEZI|nr:PX domain-containing protein [Golovinomyces cichoracearum]